MISKLWYRNTLTFVNMQPGDQRSGPTHAVGNVAPIRPSPDMNKKPIKTKVLVGSEYENKIK